MSDLRFGLIGLGVHGARYAYHLGTDVPGARLTAVCRRDRGAGTRTAEEHDATYFAAIESLMASGIDAACAVVPPDLHPAIAEAASAAGVALLLEKPLATDADGARRILEAAHASPAPVMVAHTLRYNPVVRRVRELAGSLGPLHLVAINQRFEPAARDWLDRPGPGGVILNTGIHEFDLLRFVTGLEVRSARCVVRSVETRATEDVFAATLELEGDAVATVDASRAVAGRSGRIELVGREGQIAADHALPWLARLHGRTFDAFHLPEPVATVRETLCDFVRLVRGEIDNPIPPQEGARAVAVAVACLRSAERGEAVAVEPIHVSGG